MKQTTRLILVEMVTNANRFLLSIFFLFISCKSADVPFKQTQELYNIIELENYNKGALYFKTISFESFSFVRPLSYNGINEYNYKKNWVLENERFVDFDTIFNLKQRNQINEKFRSLKEIELEYSKFDNPEVLSNIQTKGRTDLKNQKGYSTITFPFLQESMDGSYYAFIVRSWNRNLSGETILVIYKYNGSQWIEFAKVPYGIS